MPAEYLIPLSDTSGIPTTRGDPVYYRNRFRVEADGYELRAIHWLRTTQGKVIPASYRLYDLTSEQVVGGSFDLSGDIGAVGWVRVPLTTPLPLDSTHTYAAAGQQPTYEDVTLRPAAATPDYPLVFVSSDYTNDLSSSAPITYPETGQYAISAEVWPTNEPGPPGTSPELDASLANWFHPDTATEPDVQPKLYPDLTRDTNAAVVGTGQYVESGVFPRLIDIAAAIAALASAVNNVASAIETIRSWFTVTPKPTEQDAIDAILNRIDIVTDNTQSHVLSTEAKIDQLLTPPPPEGWTLIAETTFDTWLYWDQAAQYYFVHFDSIGSATEDVTPPGIPVCYRLAWWTPHDGAGGRERRFIDLRSSYCDDGGRMMPGLFLHSPAGGSGTIQAYTT